MSHMEVWHITGDNGVAGMFIATRADVDGQLLVSAEDARAIAAALLQAADECEALQPVGKNSFVRRRYALCESPAQPEAHP